MHSTILYISFGTVFFVVVGTTMNCKRFYDKKVINVILNNKTRIKQKVKLINCFVNGSNFKKFKYFFRNILTF